MPSSLSAFIQRGSSFLTPSASSSSLASPTNSTFVKAAQGSLFPKVDPAIDGEDCDHDCASCTTHYPSKFKIDEDEELYGRVNGWATHLVVATGKTDWVRDVEDEKGSVMSAVGKSHVKPGNGKLMLSASNIPVPQSSTIYEQGCEPTTVLLLPAFTFIENVTPQSVPELISHCISTAPTNTSPLPQKGADAVLAGPQSLPSSMPFRSRSCPHDAIILMCSQKTRDARCGQSAPLLRREFERLLRPLGLYRDLQDDRPGGVGIYFISHVGGHKFSANVMVYRRAGMGKKVIVDGGAGLMTMGAAASENTSGEAAQCVWLARVRPEDCEGIIKFTVLQGKVVKPERQLRGGFDRERGLCSW